MAKRSNMEIYTL